MLFWAMQSAVKPCLIVKLHEDPDRLCSSNSNFEKLSFDELEGVVGCGDTLLSWPPYWDDFSRNHPDLLLTRVAPLAEWELGKGRYGGRYVKPNQPR